MQFASVELQNDPVVVLASVKQCGSALRFASVELQNNPVVVLAAVKQWGYALQSFGRIVQVYKYVFVTNTNVVLKRLTENIEWILREKI